MFRSFFLTLVLFISAYIPSLLGYHCESSYCNTLGSGFLIGGYGVFHTFNFHTEDAVPGSNTIQNQFWSYDATQRAPGGGGFIGYGVSLCKRFTLALKAAATGYSSEAKHSFFVDQSDAPQYYPNKMRVEYIIDLSLEPGVNIGNCLLLYFKFGPSYVGWRQTRQIFNVGLPQLRIFGEDKKHFHNWGYVFGVGANTLITRCISAFTELGWHSYPLNNSKRTLFNTLDPLTNLEYRTNRLYGFNFRFGLMAGF
ncbi:MAG: hypothetical protein WAM28_04285 [Chlamydiales bacterium]